MIVQETYSPYPMAANAGAAVVATLRGGAIGGFLPTVSGNIKITQDSGAGATMLDTFPVTAGYFVPIPILVPPGVGIYVQLSGGAAGTVLVL
jgi:hypothetical protein